mmetsp:Transcript_13565/g.32126  ORF Transcript_13565/g.32126 Transcript_13565/m.32126 type:complete len:225 (-) Transcript_13565:277-951(-)
MANARVGIVYYSLYGHVRKLAEAVVEGLDVAGCTAELLQVPEILSPEALKRLGAPSKAPDKVAQVADLKGYDGLLFGSPTRFGMIAGPLKRFMDSMGHTHFDDTPLVKIPRSLWKEEGLSGKPAGGFVSTGTQGGGQETTLLSLQIMLTHHGMMFVPLGYTTPLLNNMDEVHGASAWGPGCYAGPEGARVPSDLEKDIARHYGWKFGSIAAKLKEANEKHDSDE